MLTILIGLVGMFMIYMSIANEAWGTLAVTIVILLFLMIGSWNEREDWKAYVNRRDYWAHGICPEDKRRRKTKERIERRRTISAEAEAVGQARADTHRIGTPERPFVCAKCGGEYEETGRKVYRDGTTILDCRCTGCGWQKLMILEEWMGNAPLKMAGGARHTSTVQTISAVQKVQTSTPGRTAPVRSSHVSEMTEIFGTRNPTWEEPNRK